MLQGLTKDEIKYVKMYLKRFCKEWKNAFKRKDYDYE